MTEAEERIFVDAFNNASTEVEYQDNIHKAIKLGRSIMASLGPNKSMFLEYENSIILAQGVCLKKAYELGQKVSG